MKKIVLIVLGIVLTYGVSNAQVRFGIKAGGTLSNITVKEEGISIKSDPKFGFEVGGLLEYSFSESLSLQPELLYVNSGGKFDAGLLDENAIFQFNQLQLPVNLKYKIGTDNLKFFVTAGPYLGYLFSAKIKVGPVSVDAFTEELGLQLKHLDLGLGVGFGAEISSKFIVGAGYKYGLANLTESKGITVKSGMFNLSVGYLF
jgi:opacity protein-like surface antigen